MGGYERPSNEHMTRIAITIKRSHSEHPTFDVLATQSTESGPPSVHSYQVTLSAQQERDFYDFTLLWAQKREIDQGLLYTTGSALYQLFLERVLSTTAERTPTLLLLTIESELLRKLPWEAARSQTSFLYSQQVHVVRAANYVARNRHTPQAFRRLVVIHAEGHTGEETAEIQSVGERLAASVQELGVATASDQVGQLRELEDALSKQTDCLVVIAHGTRQNGADTELMLSSGVTIPVPQFASLMAAHSPASTVLLLSCHTADSRIGTNTELTSAAALLVSLGGAAAAVGSHGPLPLDTAASMGERILERLARGDPLPDALSYARNAVGTDVDRARLAAYAAPDSVIDRDLQAAKLILETSNDGGRYQVVMPTYIHGLKASDYASHKDGPAVKSLKALDCFKYSGRTYSRSGVIAALAFVDLVKELDPTGETSLVDDGFSEEPQADPPTTVGCVGSVSNSILTRTLGNYRSVVRVDDHYDPASAPGITATVQHDSAIQRQWAIVVELGHTRRAFNIPSPIEHAAEWRVADDFALLAKLRVRDTPVLAFSGLGDRATTAAAEYLRNQSDEIVELVGVSEFLAILRLRPVFGTSLELLCRLSNAGGVYEASLAYSSSGLR